MDAWGSAIQQVCGILSVGKIGLGIVYPHHAHPIELCYNKDGNINTVQKPQCKTTKTKTGNFTQSTTCTSEFDTLCRTKQTVIFLFATLTLEVYL